MPGSRYLFLLIALSVSLVQSWDVALTVKDRLEFYSDQNKIDTEKSQFGDLSALTYDAAHNILFFADKPSDNASIVSFNLTTRKYQPLVRRKPKDNIQAVAFDPVQGLLFWTDTIEKSIYYMSLTSRSQANFYGNLFIKMDDEIPTGIAIDSCRGYVYWTNKNITKPTIERARFDGTERTVIVETNIFMPVSIAIDQQTKRLYWVDDKEGIHYSIESSDLNGKDRMTLLTGAYHTPNYITVAKDSIFWVDIDSGTVWTIPKTVTKNTEPNKYVTLNNEVPFGIVANYNIEDQIKNSPECEILTHHKENKTSIKESFTPLPDVDLFCVHGVKVIGKLACNCTAGYTGERCDVSVCNNYCYSGDCTFTAEGQPMCSCNVGYVGKRCEINICYNYCLNHGVCKINEKNQPICSCSAIFEGSRCENVKPIPTTTPLLTTVRATEKTHSLPETEVACNCKNEVTGKTREPELCYNYCLNNGTCELNEKDEPTCSCSIDFEGSRCEDIKVIPSSMSSRTTMRTTEETQSLPETEVTCNCKEGPAGKTREIEKCHNYCLNDGSCEINDKYEPICSCSIDFEGSRCENVKHIPTSKSATEETQLLPETEVTCNCTKEENASAIQSSYNSVDKYEYVGENSCNDDWNSFSHPAFIVLSISCGALCVVCVFLITKIMQLKKRPRIKKRIIVNKNVTPLTARPDQCEITIENCCNMNICETVDDDDDDKPWVPRR